MTNSQHNKIYPADKALQYFFDELTNPQTQIESNISAKASALMDDQSFAEISQAERLLSKTNILNDLLLGSSTKTFKEKVEPFKPAEKLIGKKQQNIGTAPLDEIVKDKFIDDIGNEQIRNLEESLKGSLSNKFQVLLCEISSIKIAIPLVELGGIHQISELSQVAQQAYWCAGVLVKDNRNYTCIDACAWLKPHKLINDPVDSYKYGLQLGKTSFLLCCNSIKDTVELSKDDINWRENLHTQPWLAGLVRTEMCALIDGAHMVQNVLK